MSKREYLNNLLGLMTEKQTDLFNRMYPDSPTDRQVGHAIVQCENTLKALNVKVEGLTNIKKEFEEFKKQSEGDANECSKEIHLLERNLVGLTEKIKQLINPIVTDNADIQVRLAKLDALEAGGVDSWTWYGESLEQAGL